MHNTFAYAKKFMFHVIVITLIFSLFDICYNELFVIKNCYLIEYFCYYKAKLKNLHSL